MQTQNLFASFAAVLITSGTLAVITHNLGGNNVRQVIPAQTVGIQVTNLAPVNVSPNAEELRSASLLTDASVIGLASMPSLARTEGSGSATQLGLIGAQLAMPYYSFGNKFGRISKE